MIQAPDVLVRAVLGCAAMVKNQAAAADLLVNGRVGWELGRVIYRPAACHSGMARCSISSGRSVSSQCHSPVQAGQRVP
ncbi:hypothetical protein Lesp01_85450 [Lentzea sp. NBRC 102530]|nr:hypothetical protein Lesp01_85450 [Lentzea sp. NBRC 102530]